ncbi:MAG TPA: glucosaminidase domain-containing protein [Candidatus Tidjanibacter gallistercoris]|nr:glucosaminidase domain-containing protein [Candidatus Tidjanibacter gallistercoris]
MKLSVRFVLSVVCLLAAAEASAQREMTREEYIATYAPLAMQHQKLYGIPASIKIAQGIIESRYGNSDLSRRSNNHFGIKCKNNWLGDTVRYDDDALQECFRRYSTIEDSYRDHSEFLKSSPRYERLFRLDPKDYKGWAYGLKECGYATAPHYAASLIKCIEDYELYLLDDGELPAYLAGVDAVPVVPSMAEMVDAFYPDRPIDIDNYTVAVHSAGGRGIFVRDGIRYVVARSGDSYAAIAESLGIPERRLRRFNRKHLPGGTLAGGDMVYIDRPRKG